VTAHDEDDQLQSASGIVIARGRAEDELLQTLRRNEERTNHALTAARMVVWELDLATRRLTWSDTTGSVFGSTGGPSGTILEAAFALVHADDRRTVEDTVARALRDGTELLVEFRAPSKQGAVLWFGARGRLLRDAAGRPERYLGVGTDISERKSLEAQLRQAQKVEAVGLLAGGIAHDFNNILSVILSFSELLLDDVGPASPFRPDLQEIHRAGKRAADLTKQILAFSRQQVVAPKTIDLNAVVTVVSTMLARVLGEDIELVLRLAPGLDNVKADPGQIEQVILNLAVNAREAMPRGGKLTIETSNVESIGADADGDTDLPRGRYVMLSLRDTGVGMDEATQARIYEPFFTTKERGTGTGLGLSTVLGIVQQSGGTIRLRSEKEIGTTFRIFFPRTTDRAAWRFGSSVPPAEAGGTETILLVEDDAQVRAVAAAVLAKAGYRVLEACGPDEALAVSVQHCGTIHLLLSDVVMPRMSGPELAEQIVSRHAGAKVLFMSGYSNAGILRHGVIDDDVPFLEKPLTPSLLVRRVYEVLRG
jgi:two-component system cell cycle sensor histidine kinase/response regulator CckA